MINKIRILVLCLVSQYGMGQTSPRKPLHGLVKNDSISIESGEVLNVNSKTKTFIGSQGFFDILARESDTLLFTGLTMKSKKIVLSEKDFNTPLFEVKLNVITNHLKEVVVSTIKIKNPIVGNTQRIVDKQFFDDEKSSPKNRLMPPDGSIENGVNFVRLFKDIYGLFKKNDSGKTASIYNANFIEAANDGIKKDFYTKTLKLEESQIGLFLLFCDNDPKSKLLTQANIEFELIDFLITKSKEFKITTTFEK